MCNRQSQIPIPELCSTKFHLHPHRGKFRNFITAESRTEGYSSQCKWHFGTLAVEVFCSLFGIAHEIPDVSVTVLLRSLQRYFLSIMRKYTGNTFNSTSSYTFSGGPTEFRPVGESCVCIVVQTQESCRAPQRISKSVAKSMIINERASINLGNLVKESKYPRQRANGRATTARGIDLRAWEQ